MTGLIYASFDPAAVGPALELERSNAVLTYTGSTVLASTARATDGKSSGIWYAEAMVWGDADLSAIVGLVTANASLSQYVGQDAHGIGYRLADGKVLNNGSVIATLGTAAKGQVVGLLVDVDAQSLLIEIDGVPQTAIALPSTGPWHLAGSLAGTTGYDQRMLLNTGQRAFENGRGIRTGWFAPRLSLGMWRFATDGFLTAPDDDPPNERYRGIVVGGSALALRSGLSFWPMRAGNSNAIQSSSGTLRIANADRSLDTMVAEDLRDAQVRVLSIPDGGSYSDAVQIADLVLDSVAADSTSAIDVRVGDVLDQLDAALQDRLIPPDADESSADSVWPLSIGACRSISPPLLHENPEDEPDAAARYALHDGPVLGLGYVRDGGYPFDPGALPLPDYWLDRQGRLILARAPTHALTVDVSSVGGELPGPADDLLGGDGDFDDPSAWVMHNGTLSLGALRLENTTQGPYVIDAWARHATWTMQAGKTYRINIEIASLSGGLPAYGQRPGIVLIGSPNGSVPYLVREQAWWERAATGFYTAVVTPLVDTPMFIALTGTQSGYDIGLVKAVRAYEVKADPVDDDALQPITLEGILREIIEVRCGWPATSWSAEDARAIDIETGYAGVGFHAREPTSRRAALQAVLDSYCAALWRDDAGVIRVTRLVPPETQTPSRRVDNRVLLGDVRVTQDLGPGLTTQAKCRRNWSPLGTGSISSDTVDVSLSMRARLMADYRISVASSGALPARYQHARMADAQAFLFDRRRDAQREIDYVCGSLYAVARAYYEANVVHDDYRIGDVVELVQTQPGVDGDVPVYGLGDAAPKRVVILDRIRDPIARTCTLTMWG